MGGESRTTYREPTLKEILGGTTPSTAGSPVPLEHSIVAKRALGSRLPLSLTPPTPDSPESERVEVGAQDLSVKPLGHFERRTTPVSPEVRAELAPWTMEGFDRLLDSPEGLTLLKRSAAQDSGFWQQLAERGTYIPESESSVEPGFGLDASLINPEQDAFADPRAEGLVSPVVERPAPGPTLAQEPATISPEAAAPQAGWSDQKLRGILTRAAASSGVAADPLVPRLVRDVASRTSFGDQARFGTSLMETWAATEPAGRPESVGRFAEALRRELKAAGVSEAALLSLPTDMVKGVEGGVMAPAKSAGERDAPGIGVELAPSDEIGVESTAQPGLEPSTLSETSSSPSRSGELQSAARLTRRLSQMIRSMLQEGAHGMPLAGLRWQNGPSTSTVDHLVDRMLATPLAQAHFQGDGGDASAGTSWEMDSVDSVLLQPWFEEAFQDVIVQETRAASRRRGRFDHLGIDMGLALGRVMSRRGPVSERWRALMADGGTEGSVGQTLEGIYGWEDFSHLDFGKSDADMQYDGAYGEHGAPESGGRPRPELGQGADHGMSGAMPLGLAPTGTSMDMGRLSHVMLRPGAAAPADFNLVAPVTMAVAETAQLKPADEPVGGGDRASPAEDHGPSGGAESQEIPPEIVDLLSYEIASRISLRMKFEQERSGRWD